ncbi:putative exportin 1, putative,RNA-nuclear export factor [Trypanosoma grayi]|uniref:putative exportin 1, putative,RNA-nuclear export factor n=1 Tax=Trypanosoma grayi TaxID=71804 RepID=UPI0004F41AA4|nr:putative exportin 1, putative,RNA-nuclear export factor [Trypanosoma grayi]KEG12996.1 putative exportin 1, putative,RNA-nuclear export factor [Trypanosoma grayi]
MEAILDFSKPVDVQRFDEVVQYLSTGSPQEIMKAQEVLSAFKEKPDAFLHVGALLTNSQNLTTRFFAIQVLEDAILHRWNTFTNDQREEIRSFVVSLIVGECGNLNRMRSRKALLTKMNSALVSIAKREWPVRWPNFIQDICSSAGPNEPLVENNLNLLRLVGEEIFEFSEKTLTSRWVKRKKEALESDFRLILQLCLSVLGTTDQVLLKTDLECMEKYLSWMKPALVFNEEVLMYMANLVVADTCIAPVAVRCLTVVCSIDTDEGAVGDEQTQMAVRVFRTAFNNIVNALPTSHSSIEGRIVHLYEMGTDVEGSFVRDLNLLVITFLKRYTKQIIYDDILLISSHQMLLGMSYIDDKELFKSCVEYWWHLGEKMLRCLSLTPLYKKLSTTLSNVRSVLIKKMAKPEEVIIVEEDGELRREHMSDVEGLQMYNLMREALVFLTNLDPYDTQQIMTGLMQKQLDRSEWSWHNCSTLSWAVGAVSMSLPEEQEVSLFVTIIRGLLDLCKQMQGKENRAVIASNIMFVVGQYPRFLQNNPSFLSTVVRKIIEFMKELFPGVQEMAVDTLMKIVSHIPEKFVSLNNRTTSIAEEIAGQWTDIISLLQPQQMQTCFAAAGCMIRSESTEKQAALLELFLRDVNINFKGITERAAAQGATFCRDSSSMMELIHTLRVFSSIASTCGTAFISEMGLIIWDLQGFYRTFFTAHNTLVAELGRNSVSHQDVRHLRLAKKEILRIFERFVDNTEERDFVATNCMPSILSVVLEDYRDSLPEAKEPGAMALVTACVKKLGARLSGDCAAILDHTFDTTVAMICTNVEDYPDFRVNLFRLLQALNTCCFSAFLRYASTKEDIINGMLWVIKHTDFATMETGLQSLDSFLANISTSEMLEAFYTSFMQRIFVEVLVAAMDSLHAAGFTLHCSILIKLFTVSDAFPPQTPVLGRNAVQGFLVESLSIIPTLTETLITEFVTAAYESYRDETEFQRRFADFLIEVQVWGAEEENRLQAEEERRLREATIPGYAFTRVTAQ